MDHKLKELKKEYESIKAPDSLRKRSREIMEKERNQGENMGKEMGVGRKMKNYRRWIAVAASAAFVFTGSLNVSQAFAATVAEIPGMEGVVRVLTLDRFEINNGHGGEANVRVPKIEGLLDQELQEKLNSEFAGNANSVIAAFEADLKDLEKEYPGEDVHMGLDFNYEVRTDNDHILAIDNYIVNTVGSSSTVHNFYTIDKKSGEVLTLAGLMKDKKDYVAEISKYVLEEMRSQNATGNVLYWTDEEIAENFQKIKEDQNFYINNEGLLVICFDKYEVGPGSTGSPEFVLPADYFQYK